MKRAARFPLHLLTTFTHDTKRSPDVRARLLALGSHVDEWARSPGRSSTSRTRTRATSRCRRSSAPWPIEQERIDAYLEKAFRESKHKTNWLAPDEEWERRVKGWARAKRAPRSRSPNACEPRATRIALAMLVLKLTCPGVPTSTRATSSRRSRSSIRTTAVPSTGSCGGGCSPSDPGSATRSCGSRRSCSTCAGAGRTRSPAATCRCAPRHDVCAFMRGPTVLVVVPVSPDARAGGRGRGELAGRARGALPVPRLRGR